MKNILLGVIIIFIAISALVFGFQRRVLFPRHLAPPVPEEAPKNIVGLEQLWLGGAAQVEAWFLPGNGVSTSTPGPVVIFFHGNGEVIDHYPRFLQTYRQWGVSVALLEYRGYGRSGGSPGEAQIIDDAVELYDRLVKRPDVDGDRVLFHGRSLGGGVACGLSRRHQPAALILESTFTSVSDRAWELHIPPFLVRDRFNNSEVIASFKRPLLILHGTQDQVVPFGHGEQLAARAKHAKLVAFDAGHNDLSAQTQRYWTTLHSFLISAQIVGLSSCNSTSSEETSEP